MGWLVALRKRRGAPMVMLLLALWLTLAGPGHGVSRHPGVDETIFTIKRPQQV